MKCATRSRVLCRVSTQRMCTEVGSEKLSGTGKVLAMHNIGRRRECVEAGAEFVCRNCLRYLF